jgi:predicted phage terminase large subunit-like protein
VTGRGADLLIIDDPHSEQQGQSADPKIFESTYDWYLSGPRQRLQPGGAIIIVMTRWGKKDLCGSILKDSATRDNSDEWEVIELPAILPSGRSLWEEYWKVDELEKIKATLPISHWEAQYQQNPVSEESAIVKREWWQEWEYREPPACEFIIQSWDTAFLKTQRSDFSACTTWGVFYKEGDNGYPTPQVILLDAFQERLEFPELKRRAFEEHQRWMPDSFIVEAKAAGSPLIFELRAMGIPVQEFTPSRGNDKIARVNAVADLFASGTVWYPKKRWAEEVVEQFASFPVGDHDDLVDSATQALLRFRQGGFLRLEHDDDEYEDVSDRVAKYY